MRSFSDTGSHKLSISVSSLRGDTAFYASSCLLEHRLVLQGCTGSENLRAILSQAQQAIFVRHGIVMNMEMGLNTVTSAIVFLFFPFFVRKCFLYHCSVLNVFFFIFSVLPYFFIFSSPEPNPTRSWNSRKLHFDGAEMFNLHVMFGMSWNFVCQLATKRSRGIESQCTSI